MAIDNLDELIAALWDQLDTRSIAARCGVSTTFVNRRAKAMGLKPHRHYWTPEQDALLRALYPQTDTPAVAARIGTAVPGVHHRANKLGLHKDPSWRREHSSRTQRGTDNSGRFRKGQRPWNKGMKGLQIGGIGTRFQNGHRPHTWRPIGTERISKDGYRERKVTDVGPNQRRYRAVHLLLWEQHNGPLPSGHAVVFKDGNKSNITLDNLELVTRKELMRRNTVHNLPPEIKGVITAKARLTRVINRLEKNR